MCNLRAMAGAARTRVPERARRPEPVTLLSGSGQGTRQMVDSG
ncbi:hypothetical protein OU994_15155 [Pseudoduganella sp. SL102]|nr:hypothetical protein [Pseudoduganella sp. SL102]WBS05520.1 hypothetical protein OU994_15155 [Pseudoduganella sp. SL102]